MLSTIAWAEFSIMAQLLVRNLEEDVKARLRVLAAEHGRSMEEEVRAILRQAVTAPQRPSGGLGTEIAALFKGNGLRDGEEIPEMRGDIMQPWKFDDC
jgi:plasmid stability protein